MGKYENNRSESNCKDQPLDVEIIVKFQHLAVNLERFQHLAVNLERLNLWIRKYSRAGIPNMTLLSYPDT